MSCQRGRSIWAALCAAYSAWQTSTAALLLSPIRCFTAYVIMWADSRQHFFFAFDYCAACVDMMLAVNTVVALHQCVKDCLLTCALGGGGESGWGKHVRRAFCEAHWWKYYGACLHHALVAEEGTGRESAVQDSGFPFLARAGRDLWHWRRGYMRCQGLKVTQHVILVLTDAFNAVHWHTVYNLEPLQQNWTKSSSRLYLLPRRMIWQPA